MSARQPVNVVLLWHMHQPEYRDLATGKPGLPLVYLHALKDYSDMAWHLETVPGARAVVSFSPLLLDQLHSYGRQIERWDAQQRLPDDGMLACLVSDERIALRGPGRIIEDCSAVNEARLQLRFSPFARLMRLASDYVAHSDMPSYLNKRFFSDLVVWFHLAWLGESVRREHPLIQALIAKGHGFSLAERRQLMSVIGEQIGSIVPRYRALAKQGKVELSMTPWGHPLLPLLDDFAVAQGSGEGVIIPHSNYPGGAKRVRWHLEQGLASFIRCFGYRPAGCVPSDGALSGAVVEQMAELGFRWTVTGDGVLSASRATSGRDLADATGETGVWCLAGKQAPAMFFRDATASDKIAFNYATWNVDDAVADLLAHIMHRAALGERVIPVTLGGESVWEYFAENGFEFLQALYRQLSENEQVQLATFSELCGPSSSMSTLPVLVPGSWSGAGFAGWIGDEVRNRAWELLIDAKAAFDALPKTQPDAALLRQLAVCEGSDWFWWLGGGDQASAASTFDRMFRMHLTNLYKLMAIAPPEALSAPLLANDDNPTASVSVT